MDDFACRSRWKLASSLLSPICVSSVFLVCKQAPGVSPGASPGAGYRLVGNLPHGKGASINEKVYVLIPLTCLIMF